MELDNNLDTEALTEIETLDDFDLDLAMPTYEVWAIGYDAENNITDFDVLLDDEYTSLVEAKKCFAYMSDVENLKTVLANKNISITDDVAKIVLTLEVIFTDHEEDISVAVDTLQNTIIETELLRN